MQKLILPMLILISIRTYAQINGTGQLDLRNHKTISYLGAGISQPIFVGKDQKPLGYWQSLSLKSGLFYMQGQWGRTIDKISDSSAYIGRGFIFTWGMRFSKPTTKPGSMTLGTVNVKPKIDFGITFAHMPHDTIVRGYAYPMSFGAHLSPGLILRFSSVYLIASCDVDAMGSVEPMFKPEEKHFNMGRGIVISPMLTIGFDNGWELLAPKVRKGEGTYTTTEFHYTGESWTTHYDPVDGWVETHTIRGTQTTKTGKFSYQLRRIDGYIGIGPTAQFYTNSNYGETQMIGADFGARLGPFRFDAGYLAGKKGLGNGIRDDYAQKAVYNGQRLNYTSTVPATEMSARIGFNLAHLLYPKTAFKQEGYDKRIKILGTTFYGFTVYYKYGIMNFTGPAVYTFAGAEQALDEAFDAGIAERSAATDARLLPKSSLIKGFGCSLDFGMVSIGLEKMQFPDAGIANGYSGTMTVVLPVRKMIHMSRLRATDRKRAKKDQK